jgi:hypothetical protein
MFPVTAETITDEQLRELQREAIKKIAGSSPYHLVLPLRERPGVELLYASTYALGENDVWYVGYTVAVPAGAPKANYIAEGKRYCAELLNLRCCERDHNLDGNCDWHPARAKEQR